MKSIKISYSNKSHLDKTRKLFKIYNNKKKKFVNGIIVILDEAIEKLKKEGYTEYHLKNGEIWLSKGCPKCSYDKIRLK